MGNQIGFRRAPLASALAILLGTTTGGVSAQSNVNDAALEEVLVTARKRSESVMDIPGSVQALTQSDIAKLGVKGVADLSRFVPSLNTVDFGSGITDVVFRGATSDPGYVVQSTSSVYFDEVSITTQGQQPYIRMVDISRIEALAGPQGTIYGSDSQAGTLRIISNTPDVENWEVVLDGSARDGNEGEGSWDGSLVVNVPIIQDTLALRVVAYGAKDGGFIDNVLGTTITNDRKSDATYGRSPSGWGTLNNSDVVDENINDFNVSGVRASLLWNINEDWSLNVSHMEQKTESGSYNSFEENVGDLETVIFNKEFYDVDLELTSLTIEGDLGFAQLVSATSYYDSESSYTQDVTNYQKSYAAYYCITYDADPSYFPYYYAPPEGGAFLAGAGQYCNAPTVEGDFLSAFDEEPSSDRFAQEFRLSASGETVDWLVGVFYEESNYSYEEFFGYPTANANGRGDSTELYQQTISADWFEFDSGQPTSPSARAPFYALSSSDSEQIAVFGEVEWHVTDRIDFTVGARWFDRENVTDYLQRQPEGALDAALDAELKGDDSEIAPKLSLSYDLTDDSMVYGVYSVGYRPGGTNRQRGAPALPILFEPDEMTNYEIGYRGTFSDGAIRFAATAFYMDWKDFQFELTDPAQVPCPDDGGPGSIDGVCGQPFQVGVTNAGDASILGMTTEFDWAVTSNLLVGLNAQWLDAQTDTDIDVNSDGEVDVTDGSTLPNTPDWTGAAWASYSFPVPIAAANGYVRLQWSYSGARLSNLDPGSESFPQFEMPSYDIGDLTVGMQGDTWEVSLFVNNVTDERAIFGHSRQGGGTQENTNDGRFEVNRVFTNRPREYGIRMVKRFGGDS